MSINSIQHEFSLRHLNTFGVDVRAAEFAEFNSLGTLQRNLSEATLEPWILGGGSNILLAGDLERCVLRNLIKGIDVISESDSGIRIRVGGGVVWHDLVTWAVEHDYGGIENLALIPGTVGAAPLQNIGAYGVELAEVFVSLDAVRLDDASVVQFDSATCAFGYRDSIFKNAHKGLYCITAVELQLTKGLHRIESGYGTIQETLAQNNIADPGISDIYDAVMAIRSSKLPDPALIGNAGSFFKNPIVDLQTYEHLKVSYPSVPAYPVSSDQVKIPAGWLIEQAGWKGRRVGNVGCYEKQALVIVNYGGASGQEIYDFAMTILESVKEQFGIDLSPEVNLLTE
jgi:UDP-N-acetylmuramate dehydrogenase